MVIVWVSVLERRIDLHRLVYISSSYEVAYTITSSNRKICCLQTTARKGCQGWEVRAVPHETNNVPVSCHKVYKQSLLTSVGFKL